MARHPLTWGEHPPAATVPSVAAGAEVPSTSPAAVSEVGSRGSVDAAAETAVGSVPAAPPAASARVLSATRTGSVTVASDGSATAGSEGTATDPPVGSAGELEAAGAVSRARMGRVLLAGGAPGTPGHPAPVEMGAAPCSLTGAGCPGGAPLPRCGADGLRGRGSRRRWRAGGGVHDGGRRGAAGAEGNGRLQHQAGVEGPGLQVGVGDGGTAGDEGPALVPEVPGVGDVSVAQVAAGVVQPHGEGHGAITHEVPVALRRVLHLRHVHCEGHLVYGGNGTRTWGTVSSPSLLGSPCHPPIPSTHR